MRTLVQEFAIAFVALAVVVGVWSTFAAAELLIIAQQWLAP